MTCLELFTRIDCSDRPVVVMHRPDSLHCHYIRIGVDGNHDVLVPIWGGEAKEEDARRILLSAANYVGDPEYPFMEWSEVEIDGAVIAVDRRAKCVWPFRGTDNGLAVLDSRYVRRVS